MTRFISKSKSPSTGNAAGNRFTSAVSPFWTGTKKSTIIANIPSHVTFSKNRSNKSFQKNPECTFRSRTKLIYRDSRFLFDTPEEPKLKVCLADFVGEVELVFYKGNFENPCEFYQTPCQRQKIFFLCITDLLRFGSFDFSSEDHFGLIPLRGAFFNFDTLAILIQREKPN